VTVGACTFGALDRALAESGDIIFGCSGTISFPGPITVAETVTISGSGGSVVFSGGHKHQLFLVSGELTLVDLTLAGASVTGEGGVAGRKGAAGSAGSAGKDGADGADANGGAITVAGGGTLIAAGDTFAGDVVTAGNAGRGGGGGDGGAGGMGGRMVT
jgi:hypothetical protein